MRIHPRMPSQQAALLSIVTALSACALSASAEQGEVTADPVRTMEKTFPHVPGEPMWKCTADLNGDGRPEVLLCYDRHSDPTQGWNWNIFEALAAGEYRDRGGLVSFLPETAAMVKRKEDAVPHLVIYDPDGDTDAGDLSEYILTDSEYNTTPASTGPTTVTVQPSTATDTGYLIGLPQTVAGDSVFGLAEYSGERHDLSWTDWEWDEHDVRHDVPRTDGAAYGYNRPVAIRWKDGATKAISPPDEDDHEADLSGWSDYDQSYFGRSVGSGGGAVALLGGNMHDADRKWKIWAPPTTPPSTPYVPGDGSPTWEMPYVSSGSSEYFSLMAIEDGGIVAGNLSNGTGSPITQVITAGSAANLPAGPSSFYEQVNALRWVRNAADSSRDRLVAAGSSLWVRKGSTWKRATHAPTTPILAIANDGVLLATRSIWRNGKEFSLSDLLKEIPTSSTVSTPRFTDVRGYAMNGEGEIVALAKDAQNPGSGKYTLIKMVPVRVQGINTFVSPSVVGDLASGVDNVSLLAPAGALGRQTKQWISVPNSGSNLVRLQTSAGSASTWTIGTLTNTTFTPTSLDAAQEDLTIASSTGITAERQMTFTINGQTTNPAPIGIKAMKKRRVKLTLHPVTSRYDKTKKTSNNDDDAPDIVPTKAQLEDYLNKIYGKQVNAWFDVTVASPEIVEWDILTEADFAPAHHKPGEEVPYGNRWLDIFPTIPTSLEPFKIATEHSSDAINLYVVGGLGGIRFHSTTAGVVETKAIALGFADPANQNIYVDGDLLLTSLSNEQKLKQILNTIAHEVGHLIIGSGHPDEGGGKAPLGKEITGSGIPPKSYYQRLMGSGTVAVDREVRKQLVKAEWDAAETWLNTHGENW